MSKGGGGAPRLKHFSSVCGLYTWSVKDPKYLYGKVGASIFPSIWNIFALNIHLNPWLSQDMQGSKFFFERGRKSNRLPGVGERGSNAFFGVVLLWELYKFEFFGVCGYVWTTSPFLSKHRSEHNLDPE